jgi:hypothetical protein
MPKAIALADLLSWWSGKAGGPGMERVYWEIVEWKKVVPPKVLSPETTEILFGTIAHDRISLAGEEALVFLETLWMLEKGLWNWQADAPLPDAPPRANCAEFDLWKKYLTLAEVRRVWARRLAVAPWHIRELSRPDFDLLFRFWPSDWDKCVDGVLPTDGRGYAHPLAGWQSTSTLVARLRLSMSAGPRGDLATVLDRGRARAFALGFLRRALIDQDQYHLALRGQAAQWAKKHKLAVAVLKVETSPKWVEQAKATVHVSRHRFFGVRKAAVGGPAEDPRFPLDWCSSTGLPDAQFVAAQAVWLECDPEIADAIDAFANEVSA